MRKLMIVCLLAIGFLGSEAVTPPKAKCAYCTFSGVCYDSAICGGGCFCMKRGLDLSGYCYSIGAM